ncbi:MAG: zinc metallopeptidase [Lachnospiraceae bacterium]|nr:zinc metallopeptidase [Lachnospiraceae bacterium]
MGYYGYGYYMDPTYILVFIGAIICLLAQGLVTSTFNRYSKVRSRTNLTGRETAERILRYAGITDVTIEHVRGSLTDHYNPSTKVVNLSDSVYNSTSVAAVSVAAHECGHVIQHHKGYIPLNLRTALVPVANIGSYAAWPLIIIGLFINGSTSTMLINLGILVFSLSVLFQIVTLPVEINASRRADHILQEIGILDSEEARYTKKVLGAAALTYVASAAAAILQLLRLVLLFGGRRND